MMKENNMYRKRDGIIGLIIGVYILSRIFHLPIPIISSLSVFHLILLIGLIYYISGLVIRNASQKAAESSYSPSSYETMQADPVKADYSEEPEQHLSVRNHVDHIQLQYYENVERFSQQIKLAIESEQLYELDKMKHSNYFYSLLKENAKIEAVWTMDEHFNVVAAIPYHIAPNIVSDEAKQYILKNKVYISSLDELFESTMFIQTIIIPITSETQHVIGHIGLQIKCI